MKILIVGGTGLIGGQAALHLRENGNAVTLASRQPPSPDSPVAGFPVLIGDYVKGTFTQADLAPFDAIVFAAGNDVRHIRENMDEESFWRETQIEAVPRFVELAKRAGVKRVVHLGSYYHQVMPELAETNIYVRGRKMADENARAFAGPDFNVCTLNPPTIVGILAPVATWRYKVLVDWAGGKRPDVPCFAPAGGTNFMSVRSLVEAIWGALQRAESGKAYLVGDENLTFRAFFQKFFDAVGSPIQMEERDEEHPLLVFVPGREHVLSYEPGAAETALLGYARKDIDREIASIVCQLAAT
jgi:nucleoside-diphosphate-sugar epimerase